MFLLDASTGALLYCGAYLFSTTPCVRWPPTHPSQLAPTTLPWAALSLPVSCSGFLTRNDVSRPCSGGAKASRCFTFELFRSMLHWLPTHPGQLEPTTLPQCRLAPVSCSVGLSPPPPSLSCPLSLSLSFSLALLPLRPTLSLSLSHKGGFGTFGGSLSPPGFEPSSTGQKRCGIPTELRRVVIVPTFPIPPCVSSPVRHIAFRMGVCLAACRGTAQRLRIPGPPA